MAKTGRKVNARTREDRAAFAEQRRAQVAGLKERLAAWEDEASDEYIAAVTAMFDGYSPRNAMLIAMQNPQATDVEGFKAWLERGRCVNPRPPDVPPGEWGIKILAPAGRSKDDEITTESGKPEVVAEWTAPGHDPAAPGIELSSRQPRQRFKIAYVFDISQTHPLDEAAEPGQPGEDDEDRDETGRAERAEEMAAEPADPAWQAWAQGGPLPEREPAAAPAEPGGPPAQLDLFGDAA